MRLGGANPSGLISALILALLTGGVFWVLQGYGPESALRKFHRAAVNRQYRELVQVVAPNTFKPHLDRLAYTVDTYARNGARYQLKAVDRKNKRVVAEVAYIFPNRPLEPHIFWVVEKLPGGWRVNVNETIEVQRQMYGL